MVAVVSAPPPLAAGAAPPPPSEPPGTVVPGAGAADGPGPLEAPSPWSPPAPPSSGEAVVGLSPVVVSPPAGGAPGVEGPDGRGEDAVCPAAGPGGSAAGAASDVVPGVTASGAAGGGGPSAAVVAGATAAPVTIRIRRASRARPAHRGRMRGRPRAGRLGGRPVVFAERECPLVMACQPALVASWNAPAHEGASWSVAAACSRSCAWPEPGAVLCCI